MRILAIDPGEKRIGIAVSDPSGKIAIPLKILTHESRDKDAQAIIDLAKSYDVDMILIGSALDYDNRSTLQSRHAARLAACIREKTTIQVILWDETNSTQVAREAWISMRINKKRKQGNVDAIAATVILQSYLESID